MFDGLMADLPVDLRKFSESEEFKRLLSSVLNNARQEMKNPDSSIGLALNALFVQLTERNSIIMNEANFTATERMLISMTVNPVYEKAKA